jgi:LysM repeat protein
MNPNESPLVPQGSFLEQKNKGRARVKIAVFVVLAIHGVGLMALLMQGCKPGASKDGSLADTNVISDLPTNSMPVLDDTNRVPYMTPTNVATPPDMTTNVIPEQVAPAANATEHKVAKGESFAKIAQQYHVSVKAIQDANPGVDSSKLQIGQTIKIPAAAAPVATNPGAAPTPAANGGSQSYTVKSGDTLIKIANQFGVTVKAIRAKNNLTTDKIRVGQHLPIPAKAGAQGSTPPSEPAAGTAPTGSK